MTMKGKDLLGTISPLYGLATGRGAFGKLADSGMAGVIPTMLSQQRKKKDGTPMTPTEEAAAVKTATPMKKGGKVKKMASGGSASKRADGCAIRGKTRGKMV